MQLNFIAGGKGSQKGIE